MAQLAPIQYSKSINLYPKTIIVSDKVWIDVFISAKDGEIGYEFYKGRPLQDSSMFLKDEFIPLESLSEEENQKIDEENLKRMEFRESRIAEIRKEKKKPLFLSQSGFNNFLAEKKQIISFFLQPIISNNALPEYETIIDQRKTGIVKMKLDYFRDVPYC